MTTAQMKNSPTYTKAECVNERSGPNSHPQLRIQRIPLLILDHVVVLGPDSSSLCEMNWLQNINSLLNDPVLFVQSG